MKPELNSFVIVDAEKCTGCRSCEVACAASHRDDNSNFTIGNMDTPIVPRLFLVKDKEECATVQCRQCEDAPCAASCPTGAIKNDDGCITMDQAKCISCKTCTLVCPVGAIGFLPNFESAAVTGGIDRKPKSIAYKCDLCSSIGQEPNCIKVCPNDALKIATPEEDVNERRNKAVSDLLELVKKR